jgi:acetate kinase
MELLAPLIKSAGTFTVGRMKILVLNSGSSSQKSGLFELTDASSVDPVPPLWEAKLEWDGEQETLTIRNSLGKKIQQQASSSADQRAASVENMLGSLWNGEAAVLKSAAEIDIVGHRIVHGGPKLAEPLLIDAGVKQAIEGVSEIAPLHNEAGLQGIETAERLLPGRPQVAVFDTGFHRTMPKEAVVYPGPYEWFERGIRRYGFHGISHQYCARRAAQLLQRDAGSLKIVTCHLGNGCSLCAIDSGNSVETTMGFTPLDGIMMGTRGGAIDPGILIHLMRKEHATAGQFDNILNHRSGLLGVSGVSSDMRDVLRAVKQGNARAQLAFDIFVHRLRCGIAAMAASLAGLDALVFTAGIGENSPEVRLAACAKLGLLGVQVDEHKNSTAHPDQDIAAQGSRVRVLVIAAQEDWAIARECLRLRGR